MQKANTKTHHTDWRAILENQTRIVRIGSEASKGKYPVPSFWRSGVSRQAAKRLLAKPESSAYLNPKDHNSRCFAYAYKLDSGARQNDGAWVALTVFFADCAEEC